MFERKTVFIVGAGGSREVQFPMGEQLKTILAGKLHITSDGYRQISGDAKIFSAIREIARAAGTGDPNPWMAAGCAIAAGMPQAISIDNYLHTHANDQHVVEMGKFGIAASILEAEARSPLRLNRGQRDLIDFGTLEPSWHRTFFMKLLEGVQRGDHEHIFDNVSFITFNYDRCIEHYMFGALQNYLRLPAAEARAIVQTLTVIHPYGQVGPLPWQDEMHGIDFGEDLPAHLLPSISRQIRTFTERVDDEGMMGKIHRLIGDAEQIVCLGFSYGPMNLALLSIDARLRNIPPVLGTSLGISNPNTAVLSHSLAEVFKTQAPATLVALTCDQLLQEYSLSIA